MPQISIPIKKILNNPYIYNLSQTLIGANKSRRIYTNEFIRPAPHHTILDIGCGTSSILHFLPNTVNYIGIDLSASYIKHAQRTFGQRGKFICGDISQHLSFDLPKCDIVLATGLLHHLNDEEANKLFHFAARCLSPTGRLITYDGCYIQNQSKLAKFFLRNDRGKHVRTLDEYKSLAQDQFHHVKTHLDHGLLWIPYTHLIMICNQQVAGSSPIASFVIKSNRYTSIQNPKTR